MRFKRIERTLEYHTTRITAPTGEFIVVRYRRACGVARFTLGRTGTQRGIESVTMVTSTHATTVRLWYASMSTTDGANVRCLL